MRIGIRWNGTGGALTDQFLVPRWRKDDGLGAKSGAMRSNGAMTGSWRPGGTMMTARGPEGALGVEHTQHKSGTSSTKTYPATSSNVSRLMVSFEAHTEPLRKFGPCVKHVHFRGAGEDSGLSSVGLGGGLFRGPLVSWSRLLHRLVSTATDGQYRPVAKPAAGDSGHLLPWRCRAGGYRCACVFNSARGGQYDMELPSTAEVGRRPLQGGRGGHSSRLSAHRTDYFDSSLRSKVQEGKKEVEVSLRPCLFSKHITIGINWQLTTGALGQPSGLQRGYRLDSISYLSFLRLNLHQYPHFNSAPQCAPPPKKNQPARHASGQAWVQHPSWPRVASGQVSNQGFASVLQQKQ